MGKRNKAQVNAFLSYTHADRAIADRIAQVLGEARVHVWTDRDLQPGVEWAAEIGKELQQSQLVFLLITPEFLRSPWPNMEAGMALKRAYEVPETRVVPLLFRGVSPDLLHPLLSSLPTLDASKMDHEELRRALGQIVEEAQSRALKGK